MRTVFDIKKACDPLTMWKIVEDKAKENRKARLVAEEEELRKKSDNIITIEKFWKRNQ